ncbi:MAG: ACP S-malonyltransferase [Thermoleophilia bacterium]
MIAVMFPGQGAQTVGMGQELAEHFSIARETFDEADAVLGYRLSDVCFNGPVERLTRTDVCQPALVATEVAAWRVAASHGLDAEMVFGHSLGEYPALVAAGAMSYSDALRIAAERGAAMQEAADERPGAMAALLGMPDDVVAQMCSASGDVWPANFNCPGQVVVSGTQDGIDRLIHQVANEGGKAARLQVAGAFHSPLMEPAAERLGPALASWAPGDVAIPFLSTTTASVEPSGRLREVLLDQLTAPVRFGAAVEVALNAGVTTFVEVGVGRVLSGLVKRISREATLIQVNTPADLGELAEVVA